MDSIAHSFSNMLAQNAMNSLFGNFLQPQSNGQPGWLGGVAGAGFNGLMSCSVVARVVVQRVRRTRLVHSTKHSRPPMLLLRTVPCFVVGLAHQFPSPHSAREGLSISRISRFLVKEKTGFPKV